MPPRPVIQKTQGDAASPVVVCQSRTRHRQFFQVPAQVLCCLSGMFRRLRKIHVPVNLSLLIFPLAEDKALPFIIIPDVSQLRRQNKRLPCRQQILAYIPYPARPDLRQGKRQFFPGTVLIYAAGGPRQVNMAVPVKLATIRVKSAENTGGQAPLLRSVQQVVRRQRKEAIQQSAVGFKQWPQGIRHRECAVLARRIRQAGHHGGNPQVGGLFAAGRTSASVAALMDVTVVSAVGVAAAKFPAARQWGAAGQHLCDNLNLYRPERVCLHDVSPCPVALKQRLHGAGLYAGIIRAGHRRASPLRFRTGQTGDRYCRRQRSGTENQGIHCRRWSRTTLCSQDRCQRKGGIAGKGGCPVGPPF